MRHSDTRTRHGKYVKIAAELAPKQDEKDGTENKQEQSQSSQTAVKPETTSNSVVVQPTNTEQGHKPSMVAEPVVNYCKMHQFSRSKL